MWFPTMWHFDKCSLLSSLETPSELQSVAEHSKNIQATSKGSGQTVRMHRLIWAFAGRTYHIVGNLMSRLIYTEQYNLSYFSWRCFNFSYLEEGHIVTISTKLLWSLALDAVFLHTFIINYKQQKNSHAHYPTCCSLAKICFSYFIKTLL